MSTWGVELVSMVNSDKPNDVVVSWKSHCLESKFGATTILIVYVGCSLRSTQHPNTGMHSSELGLESLEEYAQNSDREVTDQREIDP